MVHDRGGAASDARRGEQPGSAERRQQAGFSIFLDQVTDAQDRHHWETRLYHAESGVETTLPGASPEQWIAWILEQVDTDELPGLEARAGRRRAVMEVASVEILDVIVDEDDGDQRGALHSIKAQVIVQLAGIGPLEREIGAQVLQGIARSKRSPAQERRGTT